MLLLPANTITTNNNGDDDNNNNGRDANFNEQTNKQLVYLLYVRN